ncbi:MAG TPA: GNAT family N-acetyltransferase [Actinomycetaceae bacterium]|nr:GNAT family N-acetyltransferase [Actinomycetaceae bacterium]
MPNSRSVLLGVPVPGDHLGLAWSAGADVSAAELGALAGRSRIADTGQMVSPAAVLQRVFLPARELSPDLLGHFTLAGRASDGSLAAIGTVRVTAEATRHTAAIRAFVDPSWRGRGIGRALLRWQDATAMAMFAKGRAEASAIGVPIAASMIDRRRLYAAAGFSSATRVEMVARPLGDSSDPIEIEPEGTAAPGWPTRGLARADHGRVSELLGSVADPHAFLVSGLTTQELVAAADPALSRVVLHEGEVRGGILVDAVPAERRGQNASVLGLVLDSADHRVAQGFLADMVRTLWAAALGEVTIALTPAIARTWASALAAQSYRSIALDPLYTIELP